MLGIGSTELVIIVVFGFLLFGPDKLPQMGRTIGRALRQFRETQEKLTAVVQTEVVDPMAAAAKKPTVVASGAADDDDADAPVSDQEAPARKETFAERRARLAAERAEAEAAKAAADADGSKDGASQQEAAVQAVDSGSAPLTGEGEKAADATVLATADQPAENPAELTTEDLYARRPRKRKAASGVESTDTPAGDEPADSMEGGEQ